MSLFQIIPAGATSRFSPAAFTLCLDLPDFGYRDPGVLFLGQRGSVLSTESSHTFINRPGRWEQAGLAVPVPASQQGWCPGDVLDR